MRHTWVLVAGLCAGCFREGDSAPPPSPAVAEPATTAKPAPAPPPDLHAQYVIDRGHAEAAPSMKGEYISPCEAPDRIRRYWKPLGDPALEDARMQLERYRNAMSCKSIKIYDVPGYQREADYDAAMDRNDPAAAKRIAGELFDAAMALTIDRAFVERRIEALSIYRSDPKIKAAARPRIDAQFVDVDRELAAGRYGAANLILNHLLVTAMSSGGTRPVTSAKCRNGRDPTRGCG